MEYNGHKIPCGTRIQLLNGASFRDERYMSDPTVFR
jgi:cytochrome P450